MLVKELIALLAQADQNSEVVMRGDSDAVLNADAVHIEDDHVVVELFDYADLCSEFLELCNAL